MAFDNQLGRGKDRRRPYYDSRNFDSSCRHGGSCNYCRNRRTFANKRRAPIEEEFALVAQLVEQLPCKQFVRSSILRWGTKLRIENVKNKNVWYL